MKIKQANWPLEIENGFPFFYFVCLAETLKGVRSASDEVMKSLPNHHWTCEEVFLFYLFLGAMEIKV